jgi:hypothetical protein
MKRWFALCLVFLMSLSMASMSALAGAAVGEAYSTPSAAQQVEASHYSESGSDDGVHMDAYAADAEAAVGGHFGHGITLCFASCVVMTEIDLGTADPWQFYRMFYPRIVDLATDQAFDLPVRPPNALI